LKLLKKLQERENIALLSLSFTVQIEEVNKKYILQKGISISFNVLCILLVKKDKTEDSVMTV